MRDFVLSIPPLADNIKVFKTADRNRQAFFCSCAILTVLSSPNPATEGRCQCGRSDFFVIGNRRGWYSMSLYHQMARRRRRWQLAERKPRRCQLRGFRFVSVWHDFFVCLTTLYHMQRWISIFYGINKWKRVRQESTGFLLRLCYTDSVVIPESGNGREVQTWSKRLFRFWRPSQVV